jgi:hypothetical protein
MDNRVFTVDEYILGTLVDSRKVEIRKAHVTPESVTDDAVPGQLYFDDAQRCLYQYYLSEPKSVMLLIPVQLCTDPAQRALLACTHLRSGKSLDEEQSRKNQVKELVELHRRIEDLSQTALPLILGMDANTSPDYNCNVEWKWDGAKASYVKKVTGDAKKDFNAVQMLQKTDDHVIIVRPQRDAPTVLKERSSHSGQADKRGMPDFETADLLCICNRPRATCCIAPLEEEEDGTHQAQTNADLRHMLPNVFEPSDHKGVVGWFELGKNSK